MNPPGICGWTRKTHEEAVRKLVEQLRQAHAQPDPVKALFAGHSGSGKSTELFRVKREVENLYHVVIARTGNRYSLPTVDYRQLLFFCASQLIEVGAQENAIIADDSCRTTTGRVLRSYSGWEKGRDRPRDFTASHLSTAGREREPDRPRRSRLSHQLLWGGAARSPLHVAGSRNWGQDQKLCTHRNR